MTADGSKVFFTSKEQLTHEDTDHTAPTSTCGKKASRSPSISIGQRQPATPTMRPGRQLRPPALEHGRRRSELRRRRDRWWWGGGRPVRRRLLPLARAPRRQRRTDRRHPERPQPLRGGPGEGYAPHFVATLESDLTAPSQAQAALRFKPDFASSSPAPRALATDPSSGDVYVLDAAANTVEKFDSAGHLVTSFGDTENETTHEPEPDGRLAGRKTPAGSFSFSVFGIIPPGTLAVDPSTGDLYVPDVEHGVVDRFSPSGEYLSQVPAELPTASPSTPPTATSTSPASSAASRSSPFRRAPLQVLHRTPALRRRRRLRRRYLPEPPRLLRESGTYVYPALRSAKDKRMPHLPPAKLLRTLDPNPSHERRRRSRHRRRLRRRGRPDRPL